MSNRVTIEPTEFTNVRNGSVSKGFRAYDNYAQMYHNTMESIPEDDLEFLELALVEAGDNEEFKTMIDHVIEMEAGLCIGSNYYEYEEIKHILET